MTAIELHRLSDGTGPAHAHGWMVSMLCHLLGIGCALLLMAEIEKPVLPNTFQWQVAMVEAPAPTEPAPVEKPPVEPVVQPPRPVAKPMTPVQQTVQQTLQQTLQAVATPVETAQPIQQTTPEVVTSADPVMERSAVQTSEDRTVVAKAITSNQDPVFETAAPQPTVSALRERLQPVEERTAAIEHDSSPVEKPVATVEHRVVQQRMVRFRQTQADYGWLSAEIWKKIDELKRYPAQARLNHWEGKVIVEVVIRDDGMVIGLQVAESSGRPVLDQEALAAMRKASPLTLKYPLGKSSITLQIPISYKLEG